ncbi:MAG: peptide chain release factor N(5)-glutamine methyltransferase [Gaiellaceae bacterium]
MIVDRAAAVLAEHGIDTPRIDAEWIVAHVTGVNRSELVTLSRELDDADVWPLVLRRANREPLAYVLGEWGFRRLTLRCDPRALVPRPETEYVVQRSLSISMEIVDDGETMRVLDVGTGTGAIALALADEVVADVTATDISEGALALARENADRLGLAVRFVRGDLREGLPPGPFDLVVSNPPYVLAGEFVTLAPEVRDWEPREALVDDGHTEALASHALGVLRHGGSLVVEVHEERAREIAGVLEAAGYDDVRIGRDLAGRDRVVEGRRP